MSIARDVYNFFRNKYDPETNGDNYILRHEAFEFEAILNREELDPKKKIILITGNTQSGKTFCIIATICIYLAEGNNCMIILKDKNQMRQFSRRLLAEFEELRKFKNLGETGLYDDYIYIDGSYNKSEKENEVKRIKNAFLKKPKVIIAIHHKDHVNRIHQALVRLHISNKIQKNQLALFIDEAHILGGYKMLDFKNKVYHKPDVQYEETLYKLKILSRKIFLITATPQDIIAVEAELYTKGIVRLPNRMDYVGVEKWRFVEIPDNEEKIEVYKGTLVPESYNHVINILSKKKPPTQTTKSGEQKLHPIILLARVDSKNEKQENILNFMKKKEGWVAATFNQKGIILSLPSYNRPKTVKINSVSSHKDGVYTFPKATITELFEWLKYQDFERIAIISWKSAEEGITFSSKWNEEGDMLHLTHLYIKASDSTSSSGLEQSMGRINGNHYDGILPTVYCTNKDKIKLVKAYNLHTMQIKALCELTQNLGDVPVYKHIKKMPVFENHVPNQYYKINRADKRLNKKKNPMEAQEEVKLETMNRAVLHLELLNSSHEVMDEILEKKERNKFDGSNQLRKLDETTIATGTNQHTYYITMKRIFEEEKLIGWVERAIITKKINNYCKEPEPNIRGQLTELYRTKCNLIEDEETKGLLMKKIGHEVYFRMNN